MRSFTPPLLIVTRVLLPLGFPLLTLPLTGLEIAPIARHLVFFGLCGAAMGLAIDRQQSAHLKRLRTLAADSLKAFTASQNEDPEKLSELNALIDRWGQSYEF